MKHYVMVFTNDSGILSTEDFPANAMTLQQVSLRALRELWAQHKADNRVNRAFVKTQDGKVVFSSTIVREQ